MADNQTVGGVLILPGGKPRSADRSRPWQLANLRMKWLAWSLRRSLGGHIPVRRVQYRLRGWNDPSLDALRDAENALSKMRRELDLNPSSLVLVGHSMGARVAVHLARQGVGGVVALAPWWPRDDADLVQAHCRLLTVHGTADTWTDPRSSEAQTRRARERGVDAHWVGIPDAGHYLLRDARLWHRLTTDFVTERLQVGTLNGQ
ncbi:alpha/beta fold hydrolase [Mycolicibacterium sp. P9-64]|uniref:dienelactone hydrolase family protein n=1 Tax=Mycolicibacterium sp. P9-64 TaxID=2024612 RepID=UPI0011EEE52A|nr:alpha/beta fold hydrolase [Mycolicibacterium sp. P9-64]KAA0087005.1 alpha/beta fold hydrolase [Mycolicibacterium sp. P9-64]